MLRRPGIRAPTRRLPGSADAPACRRSTPWIRTAPTCSASPTAAMRFRLRGRPTGSCWPSAGIANTAPATPAAQDIYVMDIASKRWLQITHEPGSNDFPSWAPDGRHIVFRARHRQPHRDLVHAGRRHRAASADPHGQQLHAQLELEVIRKVSAGCTHGLTSCECIRCCRHSLIMMRTGRSPAIAADRVVHKDRTDAGTYR